MINKGHIPLFLFFIILSVHGQTLNGTVIDAKTQEPLEMVAVYFDNTTVGTTTDEKGEFSISYSEMVQSTLVISYLGFEKVYINNYRERQQIEVALVEAKNELGEVFISYDDILTRRQKLRLFRDYFLGTTILGKKCKILNEDAIYLRYNDKEKTLYANTKEPIQIHNKTLGYKVIYDLSDFEVRFRYVNPKSNTFSLYSAYFLGTMYFMDLNSESPRKRYIKRRKKAFEGSIQHFMRALYNKNLEASGYTVFRKGLLVNNPWEFFKIRPIDKTSQKQVELKERVSLLFDNDRQSDMYLDEEVPYFTIDAFGHYEPILGVHFTGDMNEQRVGDMLPLDYGLATD